MLFLSSLIKFLDEYIKNMNVNHVNIKYNLCAFYLILYRMMIESKHSDIKWYILRADSISPNVPIHTKRIRISATDCVVIIGLSYFTNRDQLLLQKSNIVSRNSGHNIDTFRGIRLEPFAIKEFARVMDVSIVKKPVKEIAFPRYILSGRPDGVYTDDINNSEIVIEVKCPKKFSRKCPVGPFIQLQVYIYLYGSPYGYYVEYIENRPLNILKIDANLEFMKSMLCHMSKFSNDVGKVKQIATKILKE